jgi:protease PrsW
MSYTLLRNNQRFGPYSAQNLKVYVEEGSILLADEIESNTGTPTTVREILKQNKLAANIKNKGSFVEQIKKIGKELIVPKGEFIKKDILKDKRLLYLSVLGLAPAFLIKFSFSNWLTFYAIALYFSVLWGIFFFYIFKTPQVKTKQTIGLFFLTQVAALVLVNAQNLPIISSLYAFTETSFIVTRFIGYTLGVGVLEETIKALPLFYILKTSKQPLIPQTMVYYGLMSGIGFGVLEGVQYQTTINATLNYSEAFFMNIARLTSLPFLHAIWCGIAGYFLSFAFLYPLFRKGFWVLAIAIPALLHGFYDTFGWSIIGLASTLISVILLMFYLKRSSDYQSKLLTFK